MRVADGVWTNVTEGLACAKALCSVRPASLRQSSGGSMIPPKGTELLGSPCRELTGLGRAAHLGVTVGRFLLVRWRNGFKSRLALGGR